MQIMQKNKSEHKILLVCDLFLMFSTFFTTPKSINWMYLLRLYDLCGKLEWKKICIFCNSCWLEKLKFLFEKKNSHVNGFNDFNFLSFSLLQVFHFNFKWENENFLFYISFVVSHILWLNWPYNYILLITQLINNCFCRLMYFLFTILIFLNLISISNTNIWTENTNFGWNEMNVWEKEHFFVRFSWLKVCE